MSLMTLRAYVFLLSFEYALLRGDFATLYRRVRRQPVRTRKFDTSTSRRACAAIDRACVLYFKQVQCLQRSAVTVCVLRQLGAPAELVIGAQPLPFRAHAWVEVQGLIVNDRVSATETYAVLDRC
jgi:Transglutaminase-like superfamily